METPPVKQSLPVSARILKNVPWLIPFVAVFTMYSCSNNNQEVQKYKTLHEHDSLLMAKNQSDDSAINGYMHNMNDIQNTLDEIKTREKIMTVQGRNETHGNTAVADIRTIDSLIIKSHHEIAALQARMKKMNRKDVELETMVKHMTAQIAIQDSEISALQNNLAKVNTSYAAVTKQFNDTLQFLQTQNTQIQNMTTAMNTVYYAVGTEKELKKNKIITQSGGFIGIGKNKTLTPDNNTSYFTKADLTQLNSIALNAKFKKLLSTHPAGSYRISDGKTADSLIITDKNAFWSEDRYLVVAVK